MSVPKFKPSTPAEFSPALLRARRDHLKLTRADLGRRAGRTESAIFKIESGRVVPSVTTLTRLCDALGCALNSVMAPPDPGADPPQGRAPRSHGLTHEEIRDRYVRSVTAQGLPLTIEDPATIDRVVAVLTALRVGGDAA